MKICPKCGVEHIKSGTFCSRACANSRGPRSDEFKTKVRQKLFRKLKNKVNENNRYFRELDRFRKQAEGPFSFIVLNTCKITGQKFYSWRHREYSDQSLYNDSLKYRRCAGFRFSDSLLQNIPGNELIEKYGWYHSTKNPNGVSRDHMLSKKDGFLQGISAEIIRHPANCRIVQHPINNAKHVKSIITLEELLNRIASWPKT